ncbi:hypothetical protein FQZ97_1106890 [compost metagenome]
MGICPTERGKEIGSLPAGLCAPNSTSAMAWPPSVPLYQVSRMASALTCSQPRANGRPFISTSTSGLPVALSARSRACWLSGRSRRVRLEDSCDMPRASPTAATMTSACCATRTASSSMAAGLRASCTTSGRSQLRWLRYSTTCASSVTLAPRA